MNMRKCLIFKQDQGGKIAFAYQGSFTVIEQYTHSGASLGL